MIEFKEEWSELPEFLFFEPGDEVIWYDIHGGQEDYECTIIDLIGDRDKLIDYYLNDKYCGDLGIYYKYTGEYSETHYDEVYAFKANKKIIRDNKIKKLLK